MKQIIIILFLFVCIQACAQTPRYIPYRKGNLWGYSNAEGKIVLPCKYYSAGIYQDRRVYLMNLKTKKEVEKHVFSAIVSTSKDCYLLIDSTNKIIKSIHYDQDYHVTRVEDENTESMEEIRISEENGKKKLKDYRKNHYYGRVIVDSNRYDDIIKFIRRFGSLIAKKDNKIGIADTVGNILIPFRYDEIRFFACNMFMVKLDNKMGIYDIIKGVVLPCRYLFSSLNTWDGKFIGFNQGTLDSSEHFTDTTNFWYSVSILELDGQKIQQYATVKGFEIIAKSLDSTNLFGVLNNRNEWIVAPKYNNIDKDEETENLYYVTLLNGKEGYVSNTGKEYFEE